MKNLTLQDVLDFEKNYPDASVERILNDPDKFIRHAPTALNRTSHRLKEEEPRLKEEEKVTATTVTFDNGFVGKRRLHTPENTEIARKVEKLAGDVAALTRKRALTEEETKGYLKILAQFKYILARHAPVDGLFYSALTSSPINRSSFHQQNLDGYNEIVLATAKDRAYGYETGTYRKYLKSKTPAAVQEKISKDLYDSMTALQEERGKSKNSSLREMWRNMFER